jgi:hypothetical protein
MRLKSTSNSLIIVQFAGVKDKSFPWLKRNRFALKSDVAHDAEGKAGLLQKLEWF